MRRRPHSPARWPFWLLLAAWICANVPATLALHVALWARGAGHFSHYAELRQNVASLLSGRPQTPSAHAPAFATAEPPAPASPALLLSFKAADLALPPAAMPVVFERRMTPHAFVRFLAPPAPVAEVLVPPPRIAA